MPVTIPQGVFRWRWYLDWRKDKAKGKVESITKFLSAELATKNMTACLAMGYSRVPKGAKIVDFGVVGFRD